MRPTPLPTVPVSELPPSFSLDAERARLAHCRASDRIRLEALLGRIASRLAAAKPADRLLSEFRQQLDASSSWVEARLQSIPTIDYPLELPVVAARERLLDAIERHQVVVLAGETGSGKTTQLPKLCLELGCGSRGMIGHTQPRRLAARAVAQRLAEELRVPLGQQVGAQVRFSDQSGPQTLVKVMTDGILLAEIGHDPLLTAYDTLIIDEAHERSLNIDFLLGYLKRLLPRRPDLKLIITSATLDLDAFSRHFDGAPILIVEGRSHPVEIRYRPRDERDETADPPQAIVEVLREIEAEEGGAPRGDVLVFLSGEQEIRDCADHLRKALLRDTEILPLYARLSHAEQQRIFSPHPGRRVVLSTNVAETSLTVPGIRYVIDLGHARISRYSYRSKVQRLPIEPISQASARQRAGRCGRVAAGICYRLYAEADLLGRPQFTEVEIRRTNLAAVILRMLSLSLGEIDEFPFIDPPDRRLIRDGFKLLEELGAVDGRGTLTPIGRQLAQLPVDPRIGRMLLEATRENALRELLIIGSAISLQDPRERPVGKQQAADEKHRLYQHSDSDFITLCNLWDHLDGLRQSLTQSQFRNHCRRNYLSWLRLREWRELHRQLHLAARALHLRENSSPADPDAIHRALLTGLLSHVGVKRPEGDYQGTRNRRFSIFPGSPLAKKGPKWLMALELVETSKLYARTVARIDPAWIEPLAKGLLRRNHFEPHWERKRGEVVAYEQVTLHGLPIVERRLVNYGPIDPVTARDIFIRAALVERDLGSHPAFFKHNQALIAELEGLEAKSRSRDLLVNDEEIYRFYDERIPPDVYDRKRFDAWRGEAERARPDLLRLDRERLLRRDADEALGDRFPDQLQLGEMTLPLSYRFEPGHAEDGVTLHVPAAAWRQLPRAQLEWLVPGLLRDKCIALLKSLPKAQRRRLVPLPDSVDRLLPALRPNAEPLTSALTSALRSELGVTLADTDWTDGTIDDHYRMRVELLDEQNRVLFASRDPAALDAFVATLDRQRLLPLPAGSPWRRERVTSWDFDALPESVDTQQAGIPIKRFVRMIDHGDHIQLELGDDPVEARQSRVRGILRLYMLALAPTVHYLRKQVRFERERALTFAAIAGAHDLIDELIEAAFRAILLDGRPLPTDRASFEARVAADRNQVVTRAQELVRLVSEILACYRPLRLQLEKTASPALADSHRDIEQQLAALLAPGFITATPYPWLSEFPRYLKAIDHRLQRLQGQLARDAQSRRTVADLWQNYLDAKARGRADPQRLDECRWLIEELRVSLFAQPLGTRQPVSEKRILERLRQARGGQ